MGLGTLARSIFGTPNDRKVKAVRPLVDAINAREGQVKALTDQGLKDATAALRERARGGEDLDALLPETFALVREAARRALTGGVPVVHVSASSNPRPVLSALTGEAGTKLTLPQAVIDAGA